MQAAADLLRVALADIKNVTDSDKGVLIETTDGAQRLWAPNPDGEEGEHRLYAFNDHDSLSGLASWEGDRDVTAVAEEDEDGQPVDGPEVDGDEVPAGTVEEVMRWVGNDPERADRALDVEEDAKKPRATLIEKLMAVIDAEDEGDDD